MQAYSNPKRAYDPRALPDIEVFHIDASGRDEAGNPFVLPHEPGEPAEGLVEGWYWWACFPGCLPDGEPVGPFGSDVEALTDAQEGIEDDDEEDVAPDLTAVLSAKLRPVCSPRLGALVAHLLGERWTEPFLWSMSCTSDGFLIVTPAMEVITDDGDVEVEVQHDQMLGDAIDAVRNLRGVAEHASLDDAETAELARLWNTKVCKDFWAEAYRWAANAPKVGG